MQGNTLADFSFEAVKRQVEAGPEKTAFMEQPEDLGATKAQQLMAVDGVRSVAFAQVDFGSDSVKPTRLLLK